MPRRAQPTNKTQQQSSKVSYAYCAFSPGWSLMSCVGKCTNPVMPPNLEACLLTPCLSSFFGARGHPTGMALKEHRQQEKGNQGPMKKRASSEALVLQKGQPTNKRRNNPSSPQSGFLRLQ